MSRRQNLILVAVLLLAAAFTRLIPHLGNFTAVFAVALLGGAWLKRAELAILVPLVAVFASDVVLNNTVHAAYNDGFTLFYPGMGFTYGTYIAIAILGRYGMKSAKLNKIGRFIGYGVGSAFLFFMITNFGAWMGSPALYTQDLTGLMTAYAAGIPFLKGSILGTLAYGTIMIAVKEAVAARITSTQAA
ncbi:MAG: hypothetical protein HWE14_09070 [Flavobacteriia bacterium]|nr:hypothetical protein [Flavobacteriia bacterium]